MKKLLFLLAFLPSIALTQEVKTFNAPCIPIEALGDVTQKWGEEPAFQMKSSRSIASDKTVVFVTVIFINPKTYTWTMAEQHSANEYCIVAIGKDIKPLPQNLAK